MPIRAWRNHDGAFCGRLTQPPVLFTVAEKRQQPPAPV